MSRFVAIPRDAMLGELNAIGAAIAKVGGSIEHGTVGREHVVDLYPPGARVMVRVYTSLGAGDDEVRGCGEDAVRIIVAAQSTRGHHTLEAPIKILRTAPAGPDAERMGAFLGRLRDRVRGAYVLAVRRPPCPSCGRAMARRKSKAGDRPFFGCTGYPECRSTLPIP